MARSFLFLSFFFLTYFILSGWCKKDQLQSKVEAQNMFLVKIEDHIVDKVVREAKLSLKRNRKNKSRKKKSRKNKKTKNKKRKNKSRKSKHRKNKTRKNNHRKDKLRKNKSRKNKHRKNKSRKNKHRKNKSRKNKHRKNKSRKNRAEIRSCTRQDNACLKNLVDSLSYERDQITNFLAQYNRIKNFAKLVSNKAAKKREFSSYKTLLLEALGGNESNLTCGGQRMTRGSRNAAVLNYNRLASCSQTIENFCKIPDNTYSSSALDACNAIYQAIKKKNEQCCGLAQNTACTCWAEALALVAKAKKSSCDGKRPSDAVNKLKTGCITSFSRCKKAEDASIGYIATCGSPGWLAENDDNDNKENNNGNNGNNGNNDNNNIININININGDGNNNYEDNVNDDNDNDDNEDLDNDDNDNDNQNNDNDEVINNDNDEHDDDDGAEDEDNDDDANYDDDDENSANENNDNHTLIAKDLSLSSVGK